MDVILSIKLKDAVITATSKAVTRGLSVLKDDDDKTRTLSDHTLMAYTGEPGDQVQFAEYIQANIQLYNIRENYELSPKAIASFTRNELAKSLRSRKPYQVNVLIAGFDEKTKEPFLSSIDYLGTNIELPYAAHGYAAFYTFSLLDHHYRPDFNVEQGVDLMKQCIKELETRMPMNFKGVFLKVVDKDGIRDLEI